MLEIGTMGESGYRIGDIIPASAIASAPVAEPGAHGWYIVYSAHPAAAKVAIERRGWTVYVPRLWRWKTSKKRGQLRAERKSCRKVVLVHTPQPMFPGYLFVAARSAGPEAHDLLLIHNVADVIRRQRDDFVRIDNDVIADLARRALRSREESKEPPKPLTFKRGEMVRVVRGPFASFVGMVSEDSDGPEARIDVMVFSRSTPVVSPVDWLERVA